MSSCKIAIFAIALLDSQCTYRVYIAAFSKVFAARDAKNCTIRCLLGWHEQVYLQIFSIVASAFAIVYTNLLT